MRCWGTVLGARLRECRTAMTGTPRWWSSEAPAPLDRAAQDSALALLLCQVLGKEGGKQRQVVTDADRALYSCKLSPCCPRGNQHHIWAACSAMSFLDFRQFSDSSLMAEPFLCPAPLDACASGKAGFSSGPESEQYSKPGKYTCFCCNSTQ